MKNTIKITVAAFLMGVSVSAFSQQAKVPAQSCERNVDIKSQEVSKTRGKNSNIIKRYDPNNVIILPKVAKPKSRGKGPSCLISMYNYNSQKVHVYVDGNYIGTLQPNSIGVIESLKSYSNVYGISDDESIAWKETGDCNCIYVYHLKPKDGQGEIKY